MILNTRIFSSSTTLIKVVLCDVPSLCYTLVAGIGAIAFDALLVYSICNVPHWEIKKQIFKGRHKGALVRSCRWCRNDLPA